MPGHAARRKPRNARTERLIGFYWLRSSLICASGPREKPIFSVLSLRKTDNHVRTYRNATEQTVGNEDRHAPST